MTTRWPVSTKGAESAQKTVRRREPSRKSRARKRTRLDPSHSLKVGHSLKDLLGTFCRETSVTYGRVGGEDVRRVLGGGVLRRGRGVTENVGIGLVPDHAADGADLVAGRLLLREKKESRSNRQQVWWTRSPSSF